MGFKNLVVHFDNLLGSYDKGNNLELEELDRIEKVLEKKQAKYRKRLEEGPTTETPARTELRLQIVEAQIAKLRELRK